MDSPKVNSSELQATSATSKHDKRKNVISGKLGDMVSQFGSNLRAHYEAQSNAVQVDIALITRAEVYQNKPLDDDPTEVGKLVMAMANNILPTLPEAQDDFVASAGIRYTRFINKVNDSQEQRDTNLAMLVRKHDNTKNELLQRHVFHTQLAKEEHKLLESTIRKRLIQRLNTKRSQLMREKDQLDIGESNALSLNPTQFTFANPSSPGAGNKRATRNTGRRGNAEEVFGIDGRKRKAAANNNDDYDSPPPSNFRYDGKDPRSKAIYSQFEAPTYSLDRLFTTNELALTMDRAAEAATKFFAMTVRNGELGETLKNAENGAETSNMDVDGGDDESVGAFDMERTISQSMHQTRGATRSAAQNEPAPPIQMPGRIAMPTFIPVVIGGKSAAGPAQPPPLNAAEVDADMALFNRDTPDHTVTRRALQPSGTMEYQYRANPSLQAIEGEGNIPGYGGVPMSTQSSIGGQSEGDTPMSRQASLMGGLGMKRTASGASHLGVPDRRVRSRLG